MKQLLNDMLSGVPKIEEVPVPTPAANQVVVGTRCSLVSVGTERNIIEYARSSLLEKAKQNPARVKQVVDRIRSHGVINALNTVGGRLAEPKSLGYSNVGRVFQCGSGVRGLSVGQRVVSNGPHAQFVAVPKNLCVAIPADVSDEDAWFFRFSKHRTPRCSIGGSNLGESVAVVGLGVIGLLTVQILKASGCRVFAFDIDRSRLTLAQDFGAIVIGQGDPNGAEFVLEQGA